MYVEAHAALKDHKKIHDAADELGLLVPYIVGHLVLLWNYCMEFAPDGDITKLGAKHVARAAQYPGDAAQFLATLIDVGLIDSDGDELHIHDWAEYGGKLLAKRQANAEKVKQWREKRTSNGNSNDDVTPCNRNVTVTDELRNHHVTDESKRREEKSTNDNHTAREGKSSTPPLTANQRRIIDNNDPRYSSPYFDAVCKATARGPDGISGQMRDWILMASVQLEAQGLTPDEVIEAGALSPNGPPAPQVLSDNARAWLARKDKPNGKPTLPERQTKQLHKHAAHLQRLDAQSGNLPDAVAGSRALPPGR